jgi:hypothetical protein
MGKNGFTVISLPSLHLQNSQSIPQQQYLKYTCHHILRELSTLYVPWKP